MERHIFIVDDFIENIEILKDLLEQKGTKISTAVSGKEALDKIPKENPDIILLDIFMPEMDGFEVCRKLKASKITTDIPIIFLTAGMEIEYIVKGFDAGAVDYITKPFNANELITRVNTHIELKKTKENLKNANKLLKLKIDDSSKRVMKLLAAVEQSANHIIITDTEGNIEYVNKKFCEVTGYQMDEIIGNKPSIIKSGKHSTNFYNNLWTTIKSGNVWKGEIFNKKKNGELFLEFATITPILNTKGKIINFVGIKEDITAQKQAEKNILQVSHTAEEKERSRIAKELHDGISPLLAAIKLFIQSLKKQTNPVEKEKIHDQIESIINETMTSISEISNNLSPHILHNFGLETALKNHVKIITKSSNIKIKLNSDFNKRIEEKIEIAFYRIIVELINNTLKHANAKNIFIELKHSANVILLYRDNGKGFNVEKIKSKRNCMGIFNIKNRVESLNGTITIKSEINKGTKINISIPLNE